MRRRSDERGVSALELSMLAPAILLLFFFIIQGALYFYASNIAVSAAREGAALARLHHPDEFTPRQVQTNVSRDVTNFVRNVGDDTLVLTGDPNVDYNLDSGRVTVTVSGEAISLLPMELTVTREASGEIEYFRPDFGPDGP